MQRATVLLTWIEPQKAAKPSPNERFVRPARFGHQGDDWTANSWSLVVQADSDPDEKGQQTATVQFLVQAAPHQWLEKGARFSLFEGSEVLAEGAVIDVENSADSTPFA